MIGTISRSECHVIAVLKRSESSNQVGHGGGSSGGLVMCVGCGKHVDDGVMTFKCLLDVDAMLKINGGHGSV